MFFELLKVERFGDSNLIIALKKRNKSILSCMRWGYAYHRKRGDLRSHKTMESSLIKISC